MLVENFYIIINLYPYFVRGLCRIASASASVGGDIALDVAVSAPVSEDDLISASICKFYTFSIAEEQLKERAYSSHFDFE